MKRKSQFSLIICFIYLLPLAYTQQEITFKSTLISIPQIQPSYSVVTTEIYPSKTKFASTIPKDYYVKKALKGKAPAALNTQNIVPAEANTNKQSTPPRINDINNVNRHTTRKQQQLADWKSRKPLENSILATNNLQKIQWKIQALKPLSPFVIQNGLQIKISPAVQPKLADVRYVEEGRAPSNDIQAVQVGGQLKPATQLTANTLQTLTQNQPLKNLQINQNTQKTATQQRLPQSISNAQIQSTKNTEDQQQRFESHRGNLIFIACGLLLLVVVFVVVRSQRKQKSSSIAILQSRLQNYRGEVVQDEDFSTLARTNKQTSLQQQEDNDDSDGEDEHVRYSDNTLVQ